MSALIVFYILSALIITFALAAVLFPNLVRAALALAFCFFAVAGLFWLLGSPFLAVLQLVVNVGAIPIVTIFIVMMTRSRYARAKLSTLWWSLPVAGVGLLTLRFLLGNSSASSSSHYLTTERLGIELLSIRGREVEASSGAFSVTTGTILAFEVTALVLLVAFVGAIILAQREDMNEVAEHVNP